MSGDPTADPNFTGVKQPAFDALVAGHTRAAGQLDQLAWQLWQQLNKLGVDTGPATRIRTLANQVHQEATELRRRQRQVHELERDGGSGFCLPSGTYWELQESKLPHPQPGPPVPQVLQPAARNLSYELQGAEFLPPPYVPAGHSLDQFSAEEKAVISWIQANRETILREARRRNISPRAIVAAIAWEALINVEQNISPHSYSEARRLHEWGLLHPQLPAIPGLAAHQSTGPGKVHIDTEVVRQIEARGYLPSQFLWQRQMLLSSPEGSIKYIAAIMGGFADVTDEHAALDHDIRNDVPMLAQLYQGSDLDQWERELTRHPKGAGQDYQPENPMATWAADHTDFLKVALLGRDGSDPAPAIPGMPGERPTPAPVPGPPWVPPSRPDPFPGATPTPP